MEHRSEIRGLMIGAPLLLIAAFCFGLAMIHPAAPVTVRSTSSDGLGSTSKPAHSSESSKLKTLTPMPLAQTDLKALPSASPVSSNSVGDSTTSPQVTGGSSSPTGPTDPSAAGSAGIHSDGKIPVTSSSSSNGLLQGIFHGLLD